MKVETLRIKGMLTLKIQNKRETRFVHQKRLNIEPRKESLNILTMILYEKNIYILRWF